MLNNNDLNITQLKKTCKNLKITGYSKLKKDMLLNIVNKNIAILKLQRYFRKKWINGLCPISMDEIKHPCFAFIPKGFEIDISKKRSSHFIYYNLEPLVEYLLSSGDFRDPKTREPYSEDILKSIDKCCKQNKLKYKSVFKASNNKTLYRRKREREEDLVVLERCIDEVVSSIRTTMETEEQNYDAKITLNSFHFPTFHRYFRNIFHRSIETSKQVLQNTINVITGPDERPTRDPNNIKDFILQFIYTMEITYFE